MSTKSKYLYIVGVQSGAQIMSIMISKLENKKEHSRLNDSRAFTYHRHHLWGYEENCKPVGNVGVQGDSSLYSDLFTMLLVCVESEKIPLL